MALNRLTGFPLHAVQLHEAHYTVLLGRNANKQQPILFGVRTVVDDLATIQAAVAVKHLQWLSISCRQGILIKLAKTCDYA